MTIRKRRLPPGWYPDTLSGTRAEIESWKLAVPRDAAARSGIVPHAGWFFSGAMALGVIERLVGADTVIIAGGHLPAGARPLVATEDAFETPFGPVPADRELRDAIAAELGAAPDLDADNTVEILVPLVRYSFPSARVVWLRIPNDANAAAAGAVFEAKARATGRKVAVLGSTDLTHYGPNYAFSPAGSGEAARKWARGNDGSIAEAFASFDVAESIRLGNESRAACSAGAAVAAFSYAKASGATRADLLALSSSADKSPGSSFVGYCAIAYS